MLGRLNCGRAESNGAHISFNRSPLQYHPTSAVRRCLEPATCPCLSLLMISPAAQWLESEVQAPGLKASHCSGDEILLHRKRTANQVFFLLTAARKRHSAFLQAVRHGGCVTEPEGNLHAGREYKRQAEKGKGKLHVKNPTLGCHTCITCMHPGSLFFSGDSDTLPGYMMVSQFQTGVIAGTAIPCCKKKKRKSECINQRHICFKSTIYGCLMYSPLSITASVNKRKLNKRKLPRHQPARADPKPPDFFSTWSITNLRMLAMRRYLNRDAGCGAVGYGDGNCEGERRGEVGNVKELY